MHFNRVKFAEIHLSHLTHLAINLTICTAPAVIKFTQPTVQPQKHNVSDTKMPLPEYTLNPLAPEFFFNFSTPCI